MIKKYGDYISSAFLLVFSSAYFALSFSIKIKDGFGGAALVPRMCAFAIFACALTILYNAWKTNKAPAVVSEPIVEDAPQAQPNYKLVAMTLVAFALYTIAFGILGFIVSTLIYLVVQIMILAPDRNKKTFLTAVVTAIITTISIYLLFQNLFFVMLPVGSLFQGL